MFASTIKKVHFFSHSMLSCSLAISGEARVFGDTFVFILLNVVLYSELSHQFEGWCILRQRGSLHSARMQKLLGTFLHIMQPAPLFFFFLGGCRAAAQFRNIRQEQMKRTCLLVGGKCQLLHIHQQRHCLFSLEVIASFSPLILSHCGESSK